MKKWFFAIFLILILFTLNTNAQTSSGTSICNVNRDCGANDGICPENFFPQSVTCYIPDPDCCNILTAYWSKDKDGNVQATELKPNEPIYMFVSTSVACNNKDASFDLIPIRSTFFDFLGAEGESLAPIPLNDGSEFSYFPVKTVKNGKVSLEFTAAEELGAFVNNQEISKFKFQVRINPKLVSDVVKIIGDFFGINSCNDRWDNDADGCFDEALDCADGNEDNPDYQECEVCQLITDCTSLCGGWRCNPGECFNGFKDTNCPPLPVDRNDPTKVCPITLPPQKVKCYDKTVPFPFFSAFNLVSVSFLLISYYSVKISRRKKD